MNDTAARPGVVAFSERDETLEEARARNVRDALAEDIGRGDWTGLLVPAGERVAARVLCRERAVLCGRDWFDAVVRTLDPAATLRWQVAEGAWMAPDQVVVQIEAEARALLAAERPALNFIQLLSATATETRRHVDAVAGASPLPQGVQILDTRKTIPGLRQAQKYAVRTGGGHNQRLALWHGILIKENHIAAAGGIPQALQRATAIAPPGASIQIEVENLKELRQALDAGAGLILLDNFTLKNLRQAVALTAKRAILEASGGITLKNLRAVAETGVDRISIGALTKDIKAVDLSMRFLSGL